MMLMNDDVVYWSMWVIVRFVGLYSLLAVCRH